MMERRRVEVFTAGCSLCDPVVNLVKQTACGDCEIEVYDLAQGCATDKCRDVAKKYGISRVPAIVVDGKLLGCCETAPITEAALRAAGIGRGR